MMPRLVFVGAMLLLLTIVFDAHALETKSASIAIDLNSASAEELTNLPGIGPVLARRIVEARARAPFRTVQELRRVSGIGPKIFARAKPFVVAHPIKDRSTPRG